MPGAVRVEREGLERAPQRLRNLRVGGAEVPNMELVEDDVLGRGQRRLGQSVPPRRLERGVVHVHDLALHAVAGQAPRIGIRHAVRLDPPRLRDVDRDLVEVPAVLPRRVPDRASTRRALRSWARRSAVRHRAGSRRGGAAPSARWAPRRCSAGTPFSQVGPSGPS